MTPITSGGKIKTLIGRWQVSGLHQHLYFTKNFLVTTSTHATLLNNTLCWARTAPIISRHLRPSSNPFFDRAVYCSARGQLSRGHALASSHPRRHLLLWGFIMGNTFKTAFLLTALTLLLMFIGRAFGGQNGMLLALIIAAVMNFVSYFYSDKIALAMYRAQPVTREQLPRAYQIVERLTQKIGIPTPKIYVIPTESPNAFATGRNPNHASVAVTQGILSLLNDEELEGVLAHELGHVRNRDILISSIAATIAGAITFMARFGMFFGVGGRDDRREGGGFGALLMLILAPIAAVLIQLAAIPMPWRVPWPSSTLTRNACRFKPLHLLRIFSSFSRS